MSNSIQNVSKENAEEIFSFINDELVPPALWP